MYRVNLTYFKSSGLHYTSGSYISYLQYTHEIFDEVRMLRDAGQLPGISFGTEEKLIILVKVPDNPLSYPRLIV